MLCLRGFTVIFSCMVLLVVQSSHGSEIIGGDPVAPHSMPYMAFLRREKGICGGTLISPLWVLTAAHCQNVKEVLLGVDSIKANEKKFRQVLKVKKSIPHPAFYAKDRVNDLMLLKLNKKVKQTKTVKVLELGKTVREPAPRSSCLVAGWGLTNNVAKQGSDVLMSVNVTVIDRKTCNSDDYYNHKPVITSDMICAGSDGEKRVDTCQGDSGGPLLCGGALVGVTAFGRQCGVIKKPGVYGFLSPKQLNWIVKTMKKFEEEDFVFVNYHN